MEFTISRDDKWQANQEAEKITSVMQQINGIFEGKNNWARAVYVTCGNQAEHCQWWAYAMLKTEQDEVIGSITKIITGVRGPEDVDSAFKERATLEAAFKALDDKVGAVIGGHRGGDRVCPLRACHPGSTVKDACTVFMHLLASGQAAGEQCGYDAATRG